jgi:AraC-like DNA-binding protein
MHPEAMQAAHPGRTTRNEILALHTDPRARDVLRRAVAIAGAERSAQKLEYLESWRAMEDWMLRSGAGSVGVVDAYANGTFEIARISRLLRHNASASIVVYSDFANRPAEHVFRLCRAGVRAAITLGVDDGPLRVRSVLAAASNADRLDGLPTEMHQILGATAAKFFRTALSGTTKPYEPDDLALDLGLERRTLERTLQACGLPAPARLIAYCRLLHAARLMENSDRKITGIARILGFIDDSKLRKQFSMRVGACATEISRSDAVATVFDALLQACLNGGADRRTPDTSEIATLPASARTVVALEHVIDARRHAG